MYRPMARMLRQLIPVVGFSFTLVAWYFDCRFPANRRELPGPAVVAPSLVDALGCYRKLLLKKKT